VVWAEKIPALILASLIIFLGVQPTWLVRWSETTTTAMVAAIPEKTVISQVPLK
jgi:NAD(P)H-quinone oxidoreductase subunit 4